MALIAIASDKGAPGVTTAALALAAVWPRPVLLAECDQAGGDLVYRFPAADGGHLDPRRGVLSLAVVARRGMQPRQVWEHVQKLHGGLDVLAGVTNAEQGAGLSLLWGPIGKVLAALPQADVIADCGRLGADGPLYDLLVEATAVVLVSKVHVADVIRLRDRAAAFAAAVQSRGRRGFGVGVVVVAEHKKFRAALGEVQHVLGQANAPATVLGGIAHDAKGADLLSGEWGGNLDRTMLIKTAREVAQQLVQGLPPVGDPAEAPPGYPAQSGPGYPPGAHATQPAHAAHAMTPPAAAPAPAGRRHAATPAPPPADSRPAAAFSGPQPAAAFTASPPGPAPFNGQQINGPNGQRLNGPQPAAAQFGGTQFDGAQLSGPQPPQPPGLIPPAPWQGGPEPAPDLAAVTLSAPTVSADAPRTTFSRVLSGRGGRHQADPAQANPAQASPPQASPPQASPPQASPPQASPAQANPPQAGGGPDQPEVPAAAGQPGTGRSAAYSVTQAGPAQPRPARHAAPAAGRPGGGPAFSRPPMPPLTPAAGPADPEDLQNDGDPGWGAAPWQRPGLTGPPGPARPGGE
jgi:hypothetical protein